MHRLTILHHIRRGNLISKTNFSRMQTELTGDDVVDEGKYLPSFLGKIDWYIVWPNGWFYVLALDNFSSIKLRVLSEVFCQNMIT